MTAFPESTTRPIAVVPTGWRRWMPRPEVLLLIVALLWTVAAKGRVLFGQKPSSLLAALLESTLADLAFFCFVLASFAGLYLLGLRKSAARITIIIAGVTALWAVLNAAWLLSTSVQLQPGVLGVLAKDPVQFWPTVEAHLLAQPLYALPIVATVLVAASWFIYRTIRPIRAETVRSFQRKVFVIALVVGFGALFTHEIERRTGRIAFAGQVLGFSSHWSAVQASFGLIGHDDKLHIPDRQIPQVGERAVTPPIEAAQPNIVIIFLESVSYDSCTLGGRSPSTTPTLKQLASEGVEFTRTYVPVPQTNKAFFGALTGCTPDIQPDYAESVLVDRPYESLATILGAQGYQSAFFQMADGRFECGPGLFTNLGFDWAWFFENLEDESARVGYLSADDVQMIEPMFEWVDATEQPFLLSMITTVAHDPYYLPQWFEPDPSENRFDRYLRAVEYSDMFVRNVMDQLEQRGLLENTLLCVMGDHGDSFRPEARRGRFVPYEEVIRVPWVIRWPGHLQPGRKIDTMSSQLDLTPTILSMLGWNIDNADFDGANALDELPGRRLFFTSWYKDSPMGYIEGDRKVIYWPYLDTVFQFDISSDPYEKNPQTIDGPEREAIIDQILAWRTRSQFEIDPDRMRERTLFEHWHTMSSGRNAWTNFEPSVTRIPTSR